MGMIPVFRPSYDEREIEALRETLASGWLGSGPKTKRFEEAFAGFVGTPHALAVSSATAALHLAFVACRVEGAEVITTPLTFVSTNHTILQAGATPVFADVEADTLNIDPADVERKVTERTRAIAVVHYGGHSCDMDALLAIAEGHDLALIEDCAHACGGKYRERLLGSLGRHGCFSFQAVKNLATGDGGMVVTSDAEALARMRRLSWLGISRDTWARVGSKGYSWEYGVDELGFKYQMNDIAATLGLVQLEKLPETNRRRRDLAERYSRLMSDFDWLELPVEKPYAHSSWHNYVVKVADPADRDPLIKFLAERGISTGMHYIPNHLYKLYEPFRGPALPVAESVWHRLITLPLFPDLGGDEQDHIVASIAAYRG